MGQDAGYPLLHSAGLHIVFIAGMLLHASRLVLLIEAYHYPVKPFSVTRVHAAEVCSKPAADYFSVLILGTHTEAQQSTLQRLQSAVLQAVQTFRINSGTHLVLSC
jgi:hypothetical protein